MTASLFSLLHLICYLPRARPSTENRIEGRDEIKGSRRNEEKGKVTKGADGQKKEPTVKKGSRRSKKGAAIKREGLVDDLAEEKEWLCAAYAYIT